MSKSVAIWCFDGVDDLDLASALSPLYKATRLASARASIELRLLAASTGVVTGAGLRLDTEDELSKLANAHAVVIPGGREVTSQKHAVALHAALRDAVRAGARVYTVCSGAFVLAWAGLLDGRRVAVHSAKAAELCSAAACIPCRGLTRDGWLTSTGGIKASTVKGIQIGLALLHDVDPELCAAVADRMELELSSQLRGNN